MMRAGLPRLWRLASRCALVLWVIFCVDVALLAIQLPEGSEAVEACEGMVLADLIDSAELRFVDELSAVEQEETGQCVGRPTLTQSIALEYL